MPPCGCVSLDDYQRVALTSAGGTALDDDADVTVVRERVRATPWAPERCS
jgi:hypothetical protein